MQSVIRNLEAKLKSRFSSSDCRLNTKDNCIYEITGNNLSNALNNWKNQKKEIKVLHWFNDYWVYLQVSFIGINEELFEFSKKKNTEIRKVLEKQNLKFGNNLFKVSITMSIFQGESMDTIKTQLLRAEWDNHHENHIHPQPHWHIYPHKYDSKTSNSFEEFVSWGKEPDFEKFTNISQYKLIDISRVHFAMSQDWQSNSRNYIHSINKKEIIPEWISGVLDHIKEQLTYLYN